MKARVRTAWVVLAALLAGCECSQGLQQAVTYATFRDATPRGEGGRRGVLYLGVWPTGMAATGRIQLQNEGQRAVTVKGLRVDKGELGALLKLGVQAPFEVAPGASVAVEARYEGQATPGDAEVVVHFETEGEGTPEVGPLTLTVKAATAAPACDALPPVDFGFVRVGQRAQRGLRLSNPFAVAFRSTWTREDFLGFDAPTGAVEVPVEGDVEVPVGFRPSEARPYIGALNGQPGWRCPSQKVVVKGVGTLNALEWLPREVDCGWVPPGQRVQKAVTFFNASAQPQTVRLLAPTSSEVVLPPGSPSEVRMEGGTQQAVTFECAPQSFGVRQAEVALEASDTPGSGTIPFVVKGGGPVMDVPSRVDFGLVAFIPDAGLVTRQPLAVHNLGFSPTPPDVTSHLYFTLSAVDAGVFRVGALEGYAPNEGLPGDAGAVALIEARPRGPGEYEAVFQVDSNSLQQPRRLVTATARVVQVQPCMYTAAPAIVDFGHFAGGEVREATVVLSNTGTNPEARCVFSRPRLEDAAPQFGLDAFTSVILAPGETYRIKVRFTARPFEERAILHGTLALDVSSPAEPVGRVALRAFGGEACMRPSDSLDFGDVPVGCAVTRRVRYGAVCHGLTYTRFDAGIASPDFSLSATVHRFSLGDGGREDGLFSGPYHYVSEGGGAPVLRGRMVEHDVTFRPRDAGSAEGAIVLGLDTYTHVKACSGLATTMTYPVRGRGVPRATVLRRYVTGPSDVDIFVCHSADAGEAGGTILDAFADSGIRFRLAMPFNYQKTAYGVEDWSDDGQGRCVIRPFNLRDPPVPPLWVGLVRTGAAHDQGELVPSDSGVRFMDSLSPGWRHWLAEVQGRSFSGFECLESATRALAPRLSATNRGFRRSGVPLVVISIGGREYQGSDDAIPGGTLGEPPFNYQVRLGGAAGGLHLLQVHLAHWTCKPNADPTLFWDHSQYFALLMGGIALEPCEGWESVGRAMAQSTLALRRRLPLDGAPDMASLRVTVDGVETFGVTYDEVGKYLLLPATPRQGATIEVSYLPRCG